MRKIFSFLILFFSFFNNIYATDNGGKSLTKVTILSYNIRNCIPYTKDAVGRSINNVASVIINSNANIVALQEVDSVTARTPFDLLEKLEEETKMYGIYAPAISFSGGKYGIGILSKEKALSYKIVQLPGTEEERVLLIAEFENYVFCNTHLSLTEEDRLTSYFIIDKEIKKFISEKKIKKKKPIFIAGDFNDTPTSKTLSHFFKSFLPISDTTANTYPSTNADICIDYILVYKKWYNPKTKNIVSNGVITDGAVSTASDHLPIYVEYNLK